MIWAGWNEFIAMGGYGLYVWGSVSMTAMALVIEISAVHRRRRALLVRVAGNLARDGSAHGNAHDETAA